MGDMYVRLEGEVQKWKKRQLHHASTISAGCPLHQNIVLSICRVATPFDRLFLFLGTPERGVPHLKHPGEIGTMSR
jgi:hypothetical protein